MENQYEKMPLSNLKELAKEKGIKNISALRKLELINILSSLDENKSEHNREDSSKTDTKTKLTEANLEKSINKEPLYSEEKNGGKVNKNEEKISKNKTVSRVGIQKNETQKDIRIDTIVKSNVEPKVESKAEPKIEQKAEAKTVRKVEPKAEAKAVRKVEIKADTNAEPKADIKIDSKTEFKAKPKAEFKAEPKAEFKAEPKAEFKAEPKAEFKTEPKTEFKAESKMPFKSNSSNVETTKEDTIKNEGQLENKRQTNYIPSDMEQLNSGETKEGILEVLPDGYGFIRCDNFLPGENDVYVSPAQIRRFNLKTGDIVAGNTRIRNQNEKFSALLFVKSVNGFHPSEAMKRKRFEDLTPIFPNERIHLETKGATLATRMVDLIAPIGKGQRGMIVSQPKTGKTTLLKQVARAVTMNYPEMNLIILLIDERPEEVTDIKESIEGKNVEVIYSTFDELPDNHKRVSEMVIERAKRLVEHKKDVIILLDSITRLARAYNLTVQASGRTLSGGLDPAALYMPKKFFGAARNMREGGSLTILATALVDTGSRMDDVVFEEFKGTGNMELVLDRNLSEKRIFPAIDLAKSSTRRDDLLLSPQEIEVNKTIHRALSSMKSDEALEKIIDMFLRTETNEELIETIKKTKFNY